MQLMFYNVFKQTDCLTNHLILALICIGTWSFLSFLKFNINISLQVGGLQMTEAVHTKFNVFALMLHGMKPKSNTLKSN